MNNLVLISVIAGAMTIDGLPSILWQHLDSNRPLSVAAKLLPLETSRKIVGGRIARILVPGQVFWGDFWESATPIGPSLCQRRLHSVRFGNPRAPEHPTDDIVLRTMEVKSGLSFGTSYPALASVTTCNKLQGYVTPVPSKSLSTIEALRGLNAVMGAASSDAPLNFEISCQAEKDDKACTNGRAALANLPLDVLFNVRFSPARDRWPTFEFGRSGRNGASWRVTLVRSGDSVKEIRMRRSQIIYH